MKLTDVQFKVVADINKKGEGAQVVKNAPTANVRARVESKVEVETGGAKRVDERATFDKQAGTQSGGGVATGTTNKDAVSVGKGGGVLGHLIGTKIPETPDPEKLSKAQLKALLEPYFGKQVVVTSYDRDEAHNLAEAAKSMNIGDSRGKLVGVSDEGIVLERDGGKREPVKSEFWAVARIRLNEPGATDVIAQDAAYPKHFSD